MRRLLFLFPAVVLAATPRYARLAETQGTVEVQLTPPADWIPAERNLPLPESAWLRTGAASRAEIELDEGTVLHLGSETQAGLADQSRLSTGQRVTLITVERGLAYLSGAPEGRDSLVLAMPGAQVTVTASARVRVEVEDQWSRIAVLSGAVRFSSPAAELELRAGQSTRAEPANPARFFLDREVLPNELDQWAEDRDRTLASSTSSGHAVQRYGLADLDTAGEWIVTADLGSIWRPRVAETWLPFQAGRWRWYDALGYTWVSAEPWGWLPYHYGRWTRLDKLGWVWVPSKNGIFKPGEVYWLRSADHGYIGWGPLAPGEDWPASDPSNQIPQEFLKANTTYAAFQPGAPAIDPAGFKHPKDPLTSAAFEAAPPAPPFLAAKLDSVRPLVVSPRVRVHPVVEGTTYETAMAAPPPRPAPPARPTVVVITQPAPPPAPDPEPVEVPVLVPVPAGVVFVSPPAKSSTGSAPPPAPAAPARRQAATRGLLPPPARKHFRNAIESGLYTLVVQDLEARNYAKSLEELDGWTQRFHDTELADERTYYYMLAYNGVNQPAKVLDSATPLFQRNFRTAFDDPMQALSASYLAVSNLSRVGRPTRDQTATARSAARELIAFLPLCFTPERKPPTASNADWNKARGDLEALAREVLNRR